MSDNFLEIENYMDKNVLIECLSGHGKTEEDIIAFYDEYLQEEYQKKYEELDSTQLYSVIKIYLTIYDDVEDRDKKMRGDWIVKLVTLENQITLLIEVLLFKNFNSDHSDAFTQVFLDKTMMGTKIDKLKGLINQLFLFKPDGFDVFIDNIKKLNSLRNTLAHGRSNANLNIESNFIDYLTKGSEHELVFHSKKGKIILDDTFLEEHNDLFVKCKDYIKVLFKEIIDFNKPISNEDKQEEKY